MITTPLRVYAFELICMLLHFHLSPIRRKDQTVYLLFYFSSACLSPSSAFPAASCSDCFLLRPSPPPNTLPPTMISVTKRFSWSGPISATSLYTGASRESVCH